MAESVIAHVLAISAAAMFANLVEDPCSLGWLVQQVRFAVWVVLMDNWPEGCYVVPEAAPP